ncbi:MAG: peptidase domain-containing ABC transporter [Acholeplasmatales bacterium]|nr:peptidase domain-containing ABC transporter [Acholeplasmatales bacterium]
MKYYNVRQLDQTDCAAACLATISFFYGKEVTITMLRDLCGTDIKGTSLNGLLLGCKKLKFNAKTVRCSRNQLLTEKITFPFIAHGYTKYGVSHFIVVYKFTKKYAFVADPAKKEKRILLDDFFDFFDGVSVFLKPANDFIGGKIKKGNIFSKFLKFLSPHKKLFASAIIASFIITILGVVSNYFNQILIDDILPYNLKNQLVIFCIGFLIIAFINIAINAIRQHILLYLSQKIDIPLTLGYFNHIFHLPFSFFGNRKTGDILARFQDADTIKSVMSSIALSVLMDVTLVIAVGAILFFMNYKLFIIIVIMTIISIILVFIFKKPYKDINLVQMEQSAKFSSSMIESLKNVEMLKENATEDYRMETIEEDYINLVKTSFKENVLSNIQSIISGSLSTIGTIVIMWIGANFVMSGKMTLGALLTFSSMSSFFMDPIGRLVSLQLQIQEADISMKRLSEIYEIEEENMGVLSNTSLCGDIEINNISFAYGQRKPIISDFSLTIKQGSKIAIVGESGSGKTTFSKLLLGLYQPSTGYIRINDMSINEIGLVNLRNKISYVSQKVELFSGTIKDNIMCVNPNICEEKIKAIFKMAGCDFIGELPAGIDTFIEEEGNDLSGGERQRIALARSLAKDFDILIMDEATSNLDFVSESKIYDTLFNSNIRGTMVIIAHRLSTIRRCDEILVMDKGKIIERGKHKDLLELKGKYYNLWVSQVGEDIEIKEECIEEVDDEVRYE